jgi:hypothetical protein
LDIRHDGTDIAPMGQLMGTALARKRFPASGTNYHPYKGAAIGHGTGGFVEVAHNSDLVDFSQSIDQLES